MRTTLLAAALVALLFVDREAEAGKCKLPAITKGHWYQKGLGKVVIRRSSMTKKGVCSDKDGDKFLFEDRKKSCFRCLLIMSRHNNVLQYRETFCMEKDTLERVCAKIRVDSTLYTMVREKYAASECPLTTAYRFDYSETSYDCDRRGETRVRPCAQGGQQLVWQFQACSALGTLTNTTKRMDCIATWKVGSDKYLFGRFLSADEADDQPEYRCMIYKVHSSTAIITMSLDMTCRGLEFKSLSALTMELRQDLTRWPKPSCRFPEWATHVAWRDLPGRHAVRAKSDGRTFVRLRMRGDKVRRRIESRCIEPDESISRRDTSAAAFIVFTTHECTTKYECLFLRRLGDGVLLYKTGTSRSYDGKIQCPPDDAYEDQLLLIDDRLAGRTCPLEGRYALLPTGGSCDGQLSLDIGCDRPDTTVVRSTCAGYNETVPTTQCVGHWTIGNKTFIVTKQTVDNSSIVKCYGFGHDRKADALADKHCNKGIRHVFHTPHNTLIGSREDCYRSPTTNVAQVFYSPSAAHKPSGPALGTTCVLLLTIIGHINL